MAVTFRRPAVPESAAAAGQFSRMFLQVVGDRFQRRPKPEDRSAELLLPESPDRRTQIIGGRDKPEFLFAIERHRPRRPARIGVQILPGFVQHVVVPQIDQPQALRLDQMMKHIVLLQHLHVVRQNAEDGALPRLVARDDLDELLVRRLEILDFDQVMLHQLRPEQTVGTHDKWTEFFRHQSDARLRRNPLATLFRRPGISVPVLTILF